MTVHPAFLSFEEETRGSLETGKAADLVLLDRDFMMCRDDEIAKIKVLRTMVVGRFVK
jgi:hypothetical protein